MDFMRKCGETQCGQLVLEIHVAMDTPSPLLKEGWWKTGYFYYLVHDEYWWIPSSMQGVVGF